MSREILRAVLKDNVEKFNSLLQQGNDVNEITEKEKWNYLHRALMSITMPPSFEIVQYLITCGININAIDAYGNTPLHYAVKLKNIELINVLLSANVEVNHVNKDGVSPLRETLLTKPFDHNSIKRLLESGADAEQKVSGGCTIKEFADIVASEDQILIDLFTV